MKRNRIRDPETCPVYGVTIHPGILYLEELARALKNGPEAVKQAEEINKVYLTSLTIEEGRSVSKIAAALKGTK